jgi:SOS-response transcriptional repressor LexA
VRTEKTHSEVAVKKQPKPTSGLTDTEYRTLVGVETAIRNTDHKFPSVREIAQFAGYRSSGTTYRHLKTLARKQYIRMAPEEKKRGIKLLRRAPLRKKNCRREYASPRKTGGSK